MKTNKAINKIPRILPVTEGWYCLLNSFITWLQSTSLSNVNETRLMCFIFGAMTQVAAIREDAISSNLYEDSPIKRSKNYTKYG